MKNLQKGFISPIALVVIALLVIGGGVYVYKNSKVTTPADVTSNETQQTAQVASASVNATDQSIESQAKLKSVETLAIIADSDTYNGASKEINQFTKDIGNDANFKVSIKTFPVSTTKETIKDYLKKLYFDKKLSTVIFIGDIPTAQYFPGSVSQISIPTDSYYYDVYDKCPFNQQNQAFDSQNKFCNPIVLPFVISRITSPVKGSDGIQLIKNYLNNNHAFRKGTLVFDQKTLVYPQIVNDVAQENRVSTIDHISGNLQRFFNINTLPIYTQNQIIFADWENTTSNPEPNKMFLDELSKNHQYAYINAHGYPQGHLFNVTKDTLKNPNVFYADFYSCNVGKFTEADYIAGYYLLKGKSMFVKASSDFMFLPIGSVESEKSFLLKEGQSILKTIQALSPSFIIQYFGDPTLKMPQDIMQRNSRAKISLNQDKIDFGQIKVCKNIINYRDCQDSSGVKKITLNISDKGKDDLGFFVSVVPDFSLETISNSHPTTAYDKPYQVTFDSVSYNVTAGQKSSFVINMLGIVKGTYTGKILIYNNDPQKPLLEVPFKVKVVD